MRRFLMAYRATAGGQYELSFTLAVYDEAATLALLRSASIGFHEIFMEYRWVERDGFPGRPIAPLPPFDILATYTGIVAAKDIHGA